MSRPCLFLNSIPVGTTKAVVYGNLPISFPPVPAKAGRGQDWTPSVRPLSAVSAASTQIQPAPTNDADFPAYSPNGVQGLKTGPPAGGFSNH